MLVFPINAASVQESNIFLRKLWSELNQVKPMGWNMFPHRVENMVTIGISTLGKISFDYTHKGCIRNLYIDNTQDSEAISEAVQRAKTNRMKPCSVSFELENSKNISITGVELGGCKIFSSKEKVYLHLQFEAYSAWDAKMYLPNKYASILSILYEYTQVLFNIVSIQFAEKRLVTSDTEPREYNYQWIDFDECPQSEDESVILPHECLQLMSYIMDDSSYDENIELLLNSSVMLMTTKSLLQEIDYPYSSVKADIINSMACSSLEPLSQILDKSNDRCNKCGNMVFSINKKIKKMCELYFGEQFAKYVCGEIYGNRSAFLHTGVPESRQRSSDFYCPQIKAESGIIMMPHGMVRDNLFDYSSYLFRNIAHDYFCGAL